MKEIHKITFNLNAAWSPYQQSTARRGSALCCLVPLVLRSQWQRFHYSCKQLLKRKKQKQNSGFRTPVHVLNFLRSARVLRLPCPIQEGHRYGFTEFCNMAWALGLLEKISSRLFHLKIRMKSSTPCLCNFSQAINALKNKELPFIGSACLLLKKKSKAKDLNLFAQRQGDICQMGGHSLIPIPPLPLPKTQGNIFEKIVLLLILCVPICLCVYSCHCRCPPGPEEGNRFHGAGVNTC